MKIKKGLLKAKNEQGEWESLPMIRGSDAEVTAENIETALGYTPPQNGVHWITEISAEAFADALEAYNAGQEVLFKHGTSKGNVTITGECAAAYFADAQGRAGWNRFTAGVAVGNYLTTYHFWDDGTLNKAERYVPTFDHTKTFEELTSASGISKGNIVDKFSAINNDLASIPHPNSTTPTVGQMYRVSAIDADGRVTMEPCDIPTVPVKGVQVAGTDMTPDADGKVNVPVATSTSAGVAILNANNGIGIDTTTKKAYVAKSTATQINNRADTARPITPDYINTAVKATLTDSKRIGHNGDAELTDEEKGNACEVIGAVEKRTLTKIYENTFGEDCLSDVTITLDSSNKYHKFIMVGYIPANSVGSVHNYFNVYFTDGTSIKAATSSNASQKSYVYGIVDIDNFEITTAIRTSSALNTMNIYGAAYDEIKSLCDAMCNGLKASKLVISKALPAGSKIMIYAQ